MPIGGDARTARRALAKAGALAATGVAVACVLLAAPALACGGLFCNGSQVVVPPAQSAERLIFALNPPGWDAPPEGLSAALMAGPAPAPATALPASAVDAADTAALAGPTLDAYIQIAYSGAAKSFAWVLPVDGVPLIVGTAQPDIFALDTATAPRFGFYAKPPPGPSPPINWSAVSPGGGCFPGRGVGSDTWAPSSQLSETFPPRPAAVPAPVAVIGQGKVGPYEVAVLRSDRPDTLQTWLVGHGYDVPEQAVALLQPYVAEGKTFVAFRLSDDQGVGAIQPVVVRLPGTQPCIPLRLTPVAAGPVVTVTALVLADGRARSPVYSDAQVDLQAVRPTTATTTDYLARLREAVRASGGRAFVTERAVGSEAVAYSGRLPQSALALVADRAFVTRLSTVMVPDEMNLDPIFTVDAFDQEPAQADATIDITLDRKARAALGLGPPPLATVQVPAGEDDHDAPAGCSAAPSGGPLDGTAPLPLLNALLLLGLQRRRSPHGEGSGR
jgi:MYXO-CTERM domain-containing protein